MYEVVLSIEAAAVFVAADRVLAQNLIRCFSQLEQNPRLHPHIKALKGSLANSYCYQIGDYRAVYEVNEQIGQVQIVTIAHRSDIYD
jgi:mRNA interferase RelE/StbE